MRHPPATPTVAYLELLGFEEILNESKYSGAPGVGRDLHALTQGGSAFSHHLHYYLII